MAKPEVSESVDNQLITTEWYSYGLQQTPVNQSAFTYSGGYYSFDTNASFESGYLSSESPCTSSSVNTSVTSDDLYHTDLFKNQPSPMKVRRSGAYSKENNSDISTMHNSPHTNESLPVIGLDDWDSQFLNSFQENVFTLPDLDLEGINLDELTAKSPDKVNKQQQSLFGNNLIHIPNVAKNNPRMAKNEFVPLENKTQTYLNNLNQMPLELSQDTPSRPKHSSTRPIYPAPKPRCDKPTACQSASIISRVRRRERGENGEGSHYRPREKLNAAREMFKKTLDKAIQKEVRRSRRKQYPNIKRALGTLKNC